MRTIGSAERCKCSNEDGSFERKTVILGIGSPKGVKRTQQKPITLNEREVKNGSDHTRFHTVCYGSQYQVQSVMIEKKHRNQDDAKRLAKKIKRKIEEE